MEKDKKAYAQREKAYMTGKLFPFIRVGMQKVNLTPTVQIVDGKKVMTPNAPVYIYDTSGPFSDPNMSIDLKKGLPRMREAWITERRDVEQLPSITSEYGKMRRDDKSLDHLRFEHIALPYRAKAGKCCTQMYYAKQGIITPEMEYVAIRENMNCKELGIDMTDKIPVAPAAHYTVGGVKTDLSGRTNIPHLYVCGELASSGIMGANRLASNSLIECLVFGKRAVEDSLKNRRTDAIPDITPCYQLNPANEEAYVALKEQVADIMMRHAGIIRTEEGLQEGLKKLEALKNLKLTEEHEYYSQAADNLLTVARLIMRSALFRKESRGGHFRADYPEADDSYLCHVIQQKGKELRTIPVENHGKYEMDINN